MPVQSADYDRNMNESIETFWAGYSDEFVREQFTADCGNGYRQMTNRTGKLGVIIREFQIHNGVKNIPHYGFGYLAVTGEKMLFMVPVDQLAVGSPTVFMNSKRNHEVKGILVLINAVRPQEKGPNNIE